MKRGEDDSDRKKKMKGKGAVLRRVSLQEYKDEDVSEEEERKGRVTSVAACPPH